MSCRDRTLIKWKNKIFNILNIFETIYQLGIGRYLAIKILYRKKTSLVYAYICSGSRL